MDSFQCTGTFKEKTGKISKPPQEFAGDGGRGQESNGTAAAAASAHARQAVPAVDAAVDFGPVQAHSSVTAAQRMPVPATSCACPQALKLSCCVAARREKFDLNDGVALRTLDVFAGCGGLSEGLHQVGRSPAACLRSNDVTPSMLRLHCSMDAPTTC